MRRAIPRGVDGGDRDGDDSFITIEVDAWELFDLDRDPNEMRSVYADAEYAPVVTELRDRLARLRAQYEVPAEDPVRYEAFEPPKGYKRQPH